LQDNGKHWQLVILAHSMGNRPTTMALGKVYNDESGKAALQLNTADLPMLVRLCTVHVYVCQRRLASIFRALRQHGRSTQPLRALCNAVRQLRNQPDAPFSSVVHHIL
jgi:hypothetical protein